MQQPLNEYQKEQVPTYEALYETEYTEYRASDPQLYEQQLYERGYRRPGGASPEGTPPQHASAPNQQHYAPPPLYYAHYLRPELGVDGKLVAAFAYLGLWLTGFICVLFVRDNKFIRFHAMQSLLFFGGANVLFIMLLTIITHHVPFIRLFAILAFVLLNIIAGIGWLVGLFGALSGKYVKLPFVGDYAERFANNGASVK